MISGPVGHSLHQMIHLKMILKYDDLLREAINKKKSKKGDIGQKGR